MHRIDDSTAEILEPVRGAVGVKPNAYFRKDSAGGTKVSADFLNAVQNEIGGVIEAESVTLDKDDDLQLNAAIDAKISAANPFLHYAHFRDEKTTGTLGGTFTSGSDQTRDLNIVVVNNISGSSLNTTTGVITLPEGNYRVHAIAPAHVNAEESVLYTHRAKVYGSVGAIELIGRNSYVNGTTGPDGGCTTESHVIGIFEITAVMVSAATNKIEIRHRCNTTNTNDGFGTACSFGSEVEVYSEIEIWEID